MKELFSDSINKYLIIICNPLTNNYNILFDHLKNKLKLTPIKCFDGLIIKNWNDRVLLVTNEKTKIVDTFDTLDHNYRVKLDVINTYSYRKLPINFDKMLKNQILNIIRQYEKAYNESFKIHCEVEVFKPKDELSNSITNIYRKITLTISTVLIDIDDSNLTKNMNAIAKNFYSALKELKP